MARKKSKAKTEEILKEETEEMEVKEQPKAVVEKPSKTTPEQPVAPAKEQPKGIVPKAKIEPILMIEEVAREYVKYKPYYADALYSYCTSRGFPTRGTKRQLETIIEQYGWKEKSKKFKKNK